MAEERILAGTRRPKETVMIRFGDMGGVHRVKVSIWCRGRARVVAAGFMGTK